MPFCKPYCCTHTCPQPSSRATTSHHFTPSHQCSCGWCVPQHHGITGRVRTTYLALNPALFPYFHSSVMTAPGLFTILEPNTPQMQTILWLLGVWPFRCRGVGRIVALAGFVSVLTVACAGRWRGMPCGQPAVNCC